MNFQDTLPPLNVEQEAENIVEFIREQAFDKYKCRGIVVGLSGGVDSAVTAVLSLRAAGRERLKILILPEKDSNPISAELARELAEKFDIECKTRDITEVLESYGIYRIRNNVVKSYFPEFNGKQKWSMVQPGNIVENKMLNYYLLKMYSEDGEKTKRLTAQDLRTIISATDLKQRTRMAVLYQEAEEQHFVVAGTTNLSEAILGFFVKYGDGGVDLEPLSHLYKTYVYQLARHLGIPEGIIDRKPSPDTFSAEVTDDEFFFRLPYHKLDLFLWAMRENFSLETVSSTLHLPHDTVRRIMNDLRNKVEISEHLRRMPATPSRVVP